MKKFSRLKTAILILSVLCVLLAAVLVLRAPLLRMYYNAVLKQAEQNRPEDAADALERLIALSPGDRQLRLDAARLLAEQGAYIRAEYHLRQALARGGPQQAGLFAALSELFVRQDKLWDAVKLLDGVDNLTAGEVAALRPGTPSPDMPPGLYETAVRLTFDVPEGQRYYVSLTAEYPSLKTPYTEPIPLPAGVTAVQAVAVGTDGVVSPLFSGVYTLENVNFPVEFQEPEMEALIRAAIGKPEGAVFGRDLSAVTELSGTEPLSVRSLNDLALLPELEVLELVGDAGGCDISALGSLSKLRKLRLEAFGLDSIDAAVLGALTELRELRLPSNTLTTLDCLAPLTNLEALNLTHNSVIDLSGLSGMTKLIHLNMEGNSIHVLTPLAPLTELSTLNLRANRIELCDGLENMKKLKMLILSDNYVISVSGIFGLSGLETLDLSGNELEDVSDLKNLKSLLKLDLSQNLLETILPLSDLTGLTELHLRQNLLSSLAALDAMHSLRLLNANKNEIETLEPLRGLKALAELHVEDNKLTKLDALLDCPNLKSVYSYGNKVTNTTTLLEKGVVVYN